MSTAQKSARVEAAELTKSFPAADGREATPVLRGISLAVAPGEFVSIVGPSGSGKSTLLYCLAGLEPVSSGEVYLMGTRMTSLRGNALARLRRDHVGFVFQSYNLIPSLTAWDNVALPARLARRPVVPADVDAALAKVGLAERARHKPSALSGGQQHPPGTGETQRRAGLRGRRRRRTGGLRMLRLILSDLVANRRVWLGALLVSAATAVAVAVAASLIETGVRVGGVVGLALGAVSGSVLIFSLVAAVVVLGTVANLTVALQRRDYALWQLVGVLPGRVGLVVSAQLFLVSLLGAVLGCLAVSPFLQAFFDFSLEDSSGIGHLDVSFGPISVAVVLVLVVVLVVFGGRRAARRAGRVSPLESLREPDLPTLRMSRWRWLAGVVFAVVAAAITTSLPGSAVDRISVPLMLVGALVAAALSAFGPTVFGPVLTAWTSIVPASASASWYLARNSARYNLSRSSAVISSLMVAIALVGSFYTASGTVAHAARHGDADVSTGTVGLILGGPLLLSLLGAAVAVAMPGRTREREGALIRAAGGTGRTLLAGAVWEAIIYVGTALLLGSAAVVCTALIGAWAASTSPAWALVPVVVTALAGLVLMLVATVAPTGLAVRRPVTASLAAE